jgi:hypothetical protein
METLFKIRNNFEMVKITYTKEISKLYTHNTTEYIYAKDIKLIDSETFLIHTDLTNKTELGDIKFNALRTFKKMINNDNKKKSTVRRKTKYTKGDIKRSLYPANNELVLALKETQTSLNNIARGMNLNYTKISNMSQSY